MKIALLEVKDWERDYLRNKLPGHDCFSSCEKLSSEMLPQLRDCEVLSPRIYSKISAEVLGALPALRLVATRSTGFDHIDLETCRARGIRVSNVPNYGENTVAEHTFALILALSRHIHKSYVRSAAGNFSRDGLAGFDLKGKTIGVLGVGRIGLHVIKIARGFGMEVLASDVRQDLFLAELMNFRYVPVEHLLAHSDILTLHMPESPSTHHFLNAERMAMIRKGTLLINTARGGLVDTAALLKALDDGTLAGAGLDVLEGEQYISEEQEFLRSGPSVELLQEIVRDHILLRRENVVFTPHNAYHSREALIRILDTTVDNIQGFLQGALINQVH